MRIRPPRPTEIADQVLWGLRHPLRVFLWNLLALFLIRPAVDGTILLPIVDTLFTVLVVAAMRALTTSHALFTAAVAVVALTVVSRIGGDIEALRLLTGASSGLTALLIATLLFLLLNHVLRASCVTQELILSAISAYVLIGVFWGFVFLLLHEANPKSFAFDGADGSPEVQLRYLSIMTLTTVGYGDIVPKSAEARAFATIEALIGQIYLAAVVARLVGMSISPQPKGGDTSSGQAGAPTS